LRANSGKEIGCLKAIIDHCEASLIWRKEVWMTATLLKSEEQENRGNGR